MTDFSHTPDNKSLNFIVREYVGDEILDFETKEVLKKAEDVVPGKRVLAWGRAWLVTDDMKLSDSKLTGVIQFNGDDRSCWVCIGVINIHAINKLSLFSDKGKA